MLRVAVVATLLCCCVAESDVLQEAVTLESSGGIRRENPAFAKSLAHLRSENARLEQELAALRAELAVKVRVSPLPRCRCFCVVNKDSNEPC